MRYLISISIENFFWWIRERHKSFCCTKMIHKIDLLQLNPTVHIFLTILFFFIQKHFKWYQKKGFLLLVLDLPLEGRGHFERPSFWQLFWLKYPLSYKKCAKWNLKNILHFWQKGQKMLYNKKKILFMIF